MAPLMRAATPIGSFEGESQSRTLYRAQLPRRKNTCSIVTTAPKHADQYLIETGKSQKISYDVSEELRLVAEAAERTLHTYEIIPKKFVRVS